MLRLKQQYFFVSAGIQSIVRHYKKHNGDINLLDEKIRLQEENSFMNDQGGLFYFFLIKLPIMLAVLVAVCLIYIYVKLN